MTEKYDVYIGRGRCPKTKSFGKWGNPFSHKENTVAYYKVKTRKEAIEKYEQWIVNGGGQHLLKDLNELKDKTLGCWCKPKACHGDILKKLVENMDDVKI